MQDSINCACVIHGQRYDWCYVDHLYRMITQHMPVPVRLHVFTEPSRPVPEPMIKHDLEEWPEISNTKRAWWYKLQMFDPRHELDELIYFDLDVVICRSLAWMLSLDRAYFWGIHDWRSLWKPNWHGLNSSVMVWDRARFPEPWAYVSQTNRREILRGFHGDQDLLTKVLPSDRVRYFDEHLVRSWRWQIRDGGLDPRTRRYRQPGAGSIVPDDVTIMVFHGSPKPHEIHDGVINQMWL